MSAALAVSDIRPHAGSIRLILGCMFSGKTIQLVACVERYHRTGRQRCVIIKHVIDTRYDHLTTRGGIVCNNGIEYAAIPVISSSTLSSVDVSQYDVIGVTESQFYDDLMVVDAWANAGKIVICDGLDGDINRSNFGRVHELIPRCEKVKKLNAVCLLCGADAAFTQRIGGTGYAPHSSKVDPGGSDKYQPVCRACYFRAL